ncbi:MAG: DUF1801 domain-containing protein [Chitinophagaceae bacterium]|nr:MAG: DUF1801 domain-containing protein [Chitinophagaceae bacterium]
MKEQEVAADVPSYIARYPKPTQALLKELRATIRKTAPEATEQISYCMPSYKQHGPLVYFGAYQQHIGFYPGASGVAQFEKALTRYNCSKGTIQFPLDEPLPLALISKIVTFRVKENELKQQLRAEKKKKAAKNNK